MKERGEKERKQDHEHTIHSAKGGSVGGISDALHCITQRGVYGVSISKHLQGTDRQTNKLRSTTPL